MSLWLSGIGVSRGIAIGRVHRIQGSDLDIPEYHVDAGQVDNELKRYREAVNQAREQLRTVRDSIPGNTQAEIAAFIDTHLLMLNDRAMSQAVEELIREHHYNAEWALRLQRDNLISVFDQMDDDYLQSRRDDVEHVVSSIQRILLNEQPALGPRSLEYSEDAPPIVVSDNVTPADIILMQQQGVAGFITEYGGPLSHTSILARSLNIPAIVGLHQARRMVIDGEPVIIDGGNGHAICAPDEAALAFYRHRQQRDARYRQMLGKLKDKSAISKDGLEITLLANIELPGDSIQAREVGAAGIGLYRTEFLYMNREGLPDEEEQLAAYRDVMQAASGPVTIRTLDLGADKQVDSGRPAPGESNPALGLRAIRLCLKEPDLFLTQMRALLRASVEGKMQIMLPMISNVQEMRQAKHLIEEARQELNRRGQAYDPEIPIGAMIEVPAAALAASMLARHADFFSIGTNDLIQYTLAIDRVDDEVNYLYDPLHPAVLRLIQLTIQSGAEAGIPVAMCGEMASDPRHTRLLLGLGLTEFSMSPGAILEVKRIIMHSNIAELRDKTVELLSRTSSTEMRELIDQLSVLEAG